MERNIILFGASKLGIKAYNMLKDEYNIIYFVDNDEKKWDSEINGILVIPPYKLKETKKCTIIITSMYYKEIIKQLKEMKVDNWILMEDLFKEDEYYCQKYLKENIRKEYSECFWGDKIDKCFVDSVAQSWMNHYLPQGAFELIEIYKMEAKKVLIMASGCGTSVFYGLLNGYDVYGIDPEDWKNEFINMKIDELGFPVKWKEKFYKGVGEELPFKDDYFDAIISYYTLEHVQDDEKCICEMLRVTKDNGAIFIRCPDYIATYEQHYELPWLPFLNKKIASIYLKIMNRPLKGLYTLNYTTKRKIIKTINKYTIKNKKVRIDVTDLNYINFIKNRKKFFLKTKFYLYRVVNYFKSLFSKGISTSIYLKIHKN